MSKTNMDFLGRDGGQGEVAGQIMANGKLNVGMLRPWIGGNGKTYITVHTGGDPKKPENYKNIPLVNAAGTLRRDEWKQLDEAILPIVESRLVGFQDLISKGLTYNLGNAMGTTVMEHHTVSDAMEAELSMDGVSRGQGDRPEFNTHYLPIPIIHVDYEINMRVLSASRSLGNPLDTTSAERAARKVAEFLESMLFTDKKYAFGGGTIYSYLNHTSRIAHTYDAWDGAGKTGEQIVNDVLAMKQKMIDAHFYGPFTIYIPTAYETKLDSDYDTSGGSTQTIRERILKIGQVTDIKVIDTLASGNMVMVQMTSDVIRVIRGMAVQNVQWQTEGNFVNKYKVLTIQVPQLRTDDSGAMGLIHATENEATTTEAATTA
jgi:uncharacterized linocin/CFP29 family protein